MSRIRTFVAVEIADEVRRKASQLVDRLRESASSVKWVDPQNLHFTLNFLGDVDEREIPEVCQAIGDAAGSTEPFHLSCGGVGAFPNLSRPRTIWIGVDQGDDSVCTLQRKTAKALAKLGFPKENRKFHPHLTLGRIRRGGSELSRLSEKLAEAGDYQAGSADVDEVVVFSSRLEPAGPVYEALARCPLGSSA